MMIIAFLHLCLLSYSHPIDKNSSNFDSELSSIAGQFRNDIEDEDKCKRLCESAGGMVREIDDLLSDHRDEIDAEESIKLKKLKVEAEAMQYFIASVGSTRWSMYPSIEQFNLANNRVGLNFIIVSQGKYCVDILKVSVDRYVCYFARNNSNNSYSTKIYYKYTSGYSTGNITIGHSSKSIREIYCNRDGKFQNKSIVINSVNCSNL